MIAAVQNRLLAPSALPKRQHWPSTLVLATMVSLYLFAGISVTSLDALDTPAEARGADRFITPAMRHETVLPPVPEPLDFRDMTPQEAMAFNASMPISSESNPAAKPFRLDAAGESDRLRALDCLTAAVYYEAAIEPVEGQRAVAQVVLNRVRHPAFPKTVCGVVFQGWERTSGCQFTFTCDGSMARLPSEEGWARARKVAEEALAGKIYKPVGYATHYHTNWVVPYWSSSLTKLALVGTHIFYRWEGGWGRPPAFRYRATGLEPEVARMQKLALVFPHMAEGVADPLELAAMQTAIELTPADTTGRAVTRRYEPLRDQSAATAKEELAKADVPDSVRWALTGESAAAKPAPLGVTGALAPPAAQQGDTAAATTGVARSSR
ncbi:MAG: cell wall hydrolase [Alphaproteobacteria bacterium]|nr:cell wall hydrolase [Alphaproteobacteria bacterium]